MVNEPCLRFVHVARWKGAPPNTYTRVVRSAQAHCQWVNCSAGTMDRIITGTDNAADQPTRRSRSRDSSARAVSSAPQASGVSVSAPGCVAWSWKSNASYPALRTTSMRRGTSTACGS